MLGVMSWEDRSGRIDHDGPVTVWRQVADDITADIKSGELSQGSRLPSEAELAELYQVARGTVRRALAALVERETIVVVHGRGTFVAQR
jgi:GntR family transcriptional regulator